MGRWTKLAKESVIKQVPPITKPHQRLFVIQEHNANRAGLHWDIRFGG